MSSLSRVQALLRESLIEPILFMPKRTSRRLYYTTALATALFPTAWWASNHTWRADSFRALFQAEVSQFPIPLPPNTRELFQLTMEELKQMQFVSEEKAKRTILFNSSAGDIYSFGSLCLPTGGYISVPHILFHVSQPSQLKVADMRLTLQRYRTKRTRDSPIIQRLFAALVYSDEAKKAAIAHQIQFLSQPSYHLIKGLNIFTCVLAPFLLAPLLNHRLGLNYPSNWGRVWRNSFGPSPPRYVPPILRGMLVSLLAISCVLAGVTIDVQLDKIFDLIALRHMLAKLPSSQLDYRRGAVELYSKRIEANAVAYEIMGPIEGHKYLTEQGGFKDWTGLFTLSWETHLALARASLAWSRTDSGEKQEEGTV